MLTLTPADLAPFATIEPAKAQTMIDDAVAVAILAAPCLADPDLDQTKAAAARAIIRGSILRWNEAGTGALQAQTAGPFGVTIDTRTPRSGMFWPSEIDQLRRICTGGRSGAFAIDTAPSTPTPSAHPFITDTDTDVGWWAAQDR